VEGALIGVDVGGTKLSVAALEDGSLGPVDTAPTETMSSELLVEQIVAAVERVGEGRAAAVGVGVPSAVEFASGRARASVNVPLRDVPLRTILRERLGVRCYVDNDANCAALAEAHEGDRLVTRELVMLTVGTGVGGGLVLGGRPYRGATGAAGELGHMMVGASLRDGAPTPGERFPQPGSLEALARGGALDDMAATAAHQQPDSELGRRAARGAQVSARDAVEAAHAGDPEGGRLIRLIGERLGVGVANVINIFDPEVVALGGGVSAAGDLLLGPVREVVRRFVLPGVGERTAVRMSHHGAVGGLLGAALLAGQELAEEAPPGEEVVTGTVG
jgi:glucokinase